MYSKSDLQALSQLRLDDAKLLLDSHRWSSAYYLAGYAVELGIKAKIAGAFQSDSIPDLSFVRTIYTHRFKDLLSAAGLSPELELAVKADTQLGAYVAIATNWTQESRYVLWDSFAAASMVEAIADPTHGVFQWIKARW